MAPLPAKMSPGDSKYHLHARQRFQRFALPSYRVPWGRFRVFIRKFRLEMYREDLVNKIPMHWLISLPCLCLVRYISSVAGRVQHTFI